MCRVYCVCCVCVLCVCVVCVLCVLCVCVVCVLCVCVVCVLVCIVCVCRVCVVCIVCVVCVCVCDTALRPGNFIDNEYDFTLCMCMCVTHISHDMPQENPPWGICTSPTPRGFVSQMAEKPTKSCSIR